MTQHLKRFDEVRCLWAKRNHAIGMVLCLMLAVGSQVYSDEINALFQIDVDSKQDVSSAPLVGLQRNETWLVVLVDFESNPISENAIQTIQKTCKNTPKNTYRRQLAMMYLYN